MDPPSVCHDSSCLVQREKDSSREILNQSTTKGVSSVKGKIGVDPSINDEGSWDCRVQTVLANGDFDDATESFQVKFLKPATVSMEVIRGHQDGQEAEIFETENMEFSCKADFGLPQPNLVWKLNTKVIDFK